MSARIAQRFHKYHGLGNDFVLLDLLDGGGPPPPAWVAQVCARHTGVGADGVLSILRGPQGADATMHVTNADGSVPEMCGNGLRCVALHLVRHRALGPRLVIDTRAGLRGAEVRRDDVAVDMGSARASACEHLEAAGAELELWPISTGNPHAIVFDSTAPFERVGPALQHHPRFPGGVNVSFVRADGDVLVTRVWERGVGPTQACGTAACAVAVAACAAGRAPHDQTLTVRLPGGELSVRVPRDLQHLEMRGPAEEVFAGELPSWV